MLLFKFFKDDAVIFNNESGETHLLDRLDAEILKIKLEGEDSGKIFGAMLLSSGRCGNERDISSYLDSLFEQCESAGLLIVKE